MQGHAVLAFAAAHLGHALGINRYDLSGNVAEFVVGEALAVEIEAL